MHIFSFLWSLVKTVDVEIYSNRCHPKSGHCKCKPGWSGATCNDQCPLYTYGEGCTKLCTCQNDAFCDALDGHCECPSGFMGDNCDRTCPEGKWGLKCAFDCKCVEGTKCDPQTGICECKSGMKLLICSLYTSFIVFIVPCVSTYNLMTQRLSDRIVSAIFFLCNNLQSKHW